MLNASNEGLSNIGAINFTVWAVNGEGDGPRSDDYEFPWEFVPEQMNPPSIALIDDDTKFEISWDDLTSDGGSEILYYSMHISNYNGGKEQPSTDQCDLENDPTITAERKCTIDVDYLRVDPFSLVEASYVFARLNQK